MLTEYALDAAWHDKSIREKIVKSAGILSPAHACGTLIARVDKKAIIKILKIRISPSQSGKTENLKRNKFCHIMADKK